MFLFLLLCDRCFLLFVLMSDVLIVCFLLMFEFLLFWLFSDFVFWVFYKPEIRGNATLVTRSGESTCLSVMQLEFRNEHCLQQAHMPVT